MLSVIIMEMDMFYQIQFLNDIWISNLHRCYVDLNVSERNGVYLYRYIWWERNYDNQLNFIFWKIYHRAFWISVVYYGIMVWYLSTVIHIKHLAFVCKSQYYQCVPVQYAQTGNFIENDFFSWRMNIMVVHSWFHFYNFEL